MRITRVIAILLIGLLLALGACASPAAPPQSPTPTQQAPTPTLTPTPTPESPETFKAGASTSTYYELARDLQNWLGKRVHVRGQVTNTFPRTDGGAEWWLVVNITEMPSELTRKVTWVSYSGPPPKVGDVVDIWGIVGKRTYQERIFGPVITDPNTGILKREITGEIVYSEPEITAKYVETVKLQ